VREAVRVKLRSMGRDGAAVIDVNDMRMLIGRAEVGRGVERGRNGGMGGMGGGNEKGGVFRRDAACDVGAGD